VGPVTVTYPNLTLDSNNQLVITSPSTPGNYKVTCSFDGTANYNSAGFVFPLTISEEHPIGNIQLFTNPTTLVSQKPMTFDIVVQGTAGLPTPTGSVGVAVGAASTGPILFSSPGNLLVTISSPLFISPSDTVKVTYYGDPVYGMASKSFSITNPPISSGAGGSSTPTSIHPPTAGPGTPTASVTSNATPSETATAPAIAQAAAAGTTRTSGTPPGPINVGLLVLLVLALFFIAGGGVAGFLLLRIRRANRAAAADTYFDQMPLDNRWNPPGRY
jgi:hypothetical protein